MISDRYRPPVAMVGRLLLALVFVLSGLSKIADPVATWGYIASVGLPPMPIYGTALVLEIGFGLLLAFGLKARLAAAVLAAFALLAAVFFHRNHADQAQMIMCTKNIMITGGLLQIVAFGAGPYSLDDWMQRG